MSSVAAAPVAMAWEWDWDSFRRFWGRQFGKTTGVVGIAGLIVGGGVLVIISAKHKS